MPQDGTLLDSLLEEISDCCGYASCVRDAEGVIVDFRVEYVNRAACLVRSSLRPLPHARLLTEFFGGLARRPWFEACCEAVETGTPGSYDNVCVHDPDQAGYPPRYFDVRLFKCGDGLWGVWREVTERHRSHVEEDDWLFRTTFEQAAVGLAHVGLDGRWIRVNQKLCQITGYSRSELLRKTFQEITHPDDLAEDLSHLARLLDGHCTHYSLEKRYVRADGSVAWVEITVAVHRDVERRPQYFIVVVHDIGPRRQAEQALRESEERFRMLADNIAQFAWIADASGAIQWYNQRWFDYTGTDLERMRGWGWRAVHHPDHVEGVTAKFREHVASGEPWEDTFPLRGADGSYRWFLSRAVPIRDDQGRVARWFGTNTDITDQKRLEAELVQAKQRADAASEAKSQFLANVSHELRTPMSAILGMTDLALEEQLSPTVRDYLQTARESADMLLALVNEILDLSRVESGKLQLETAPLLLQATVRETVRALAVRAQEKGLELQLELAADVPEVVVGDRLRLRQILVNLVGNAIKFTERGRVGVRLEVETCTRDACQIHATVVDSGIGISAEHQPRVFEAFYQADDSGAGRRGGAGLGLAITRNLVEMMGGRIWFESAPGEGSTFHVTLRLGLPERPMVAADLEAPRVSAIPAPRRRLRILLAEDTRANQKLISTVLHKHQHQVQVVSNGREAVECLRREEFDLVLMDVLMPVMDGFEATAAIRQFGDPRKSCVPILAMTALAMKGDADRCARAGMDGYLAKPVDVADLLQRVADIAGR